MDNILLEYTAIQSGVLALDTLKKVLEIQFESADSEFISKQQLFEVINICQKTLNKKGIDLKNIGE